MRVWLKALLLFGLMVATPFVIQAMIGRPPRWFDAAPYFSIADYIPSVQTLIYIVGVVGVIAVIFNYLFYSTGLDEIHGWLKLAEREMNVILKGVDASSGKGRADDRIKWWNDINSKSPFSETPDEIFKLNEKDAANRGAPGGKAQMTAILLREIYDGDIELAQTKIEAEMIANDGKPPFVVAGLRNILGLDEFLAAKAEYEKDKAAGVVRDEPRFSDFGVNWAALLLVVRLGGFPRDITMTKGKDPDKTIVKNREALELLTRV
ncbi:hypothetical protein T281_13510 [Rhodomicrobium udaipurense JA643]|uniref:Uncharacterized protein n=1 Tax=Rhodomicrobium udaipurense TaxID=1202716 RepID=A0A8I1GCX9_9HYPH|nr:hypothetical protein [Rhodomicrobium udaipurense]KAI93990.1 hypothetical protein T281_13510 [Rhodomicrobium udaipurense JA643]MBJ7543555.1 hypothetical protein [Rhodomicrobium udaipurense]